MRGFQLVVTSLLALIPHRLAIHFYLIGSAAYWLSGHFVVESPCCDPLLQFVFRDCCWPVSRHFIRSPSTHSVVVGFLNL